MRKMDLSPYCVDRRFAPAAFAVKSPFAPPRDSGGARSPAGAPLDSLTRKA